MVRGIDLFAGGGGTSTGAIKAGVNIIWCANHNKLAVDFLKKNHPGMDVICQDLHQADWSTVPEHDILFASPCCQGHSRAAGKVKRTIKADQSRSTAWAVVSALEAHKTKVAVIENVLDFMKWQLFDAWKYAMESMGYTLSINLINAADLGVPQNRLRLIIVATRTKHPLELNLTKEDHVPARTFIDLSFEGHDWDLVADRVQKTRSRVENGRKQFGEIFLDAAYGTERSGRSLDRPIGTITTVNKHSVVFGDYIRPISVAEAAAAQSFPPNYKWPSSSTATKHMIGNAVPPLMAEKITTAILRTI
jgi:DNA (cytosine-5)-methyltransferase 1